MKSSVATILLSASLGWAQGFFDQGAPQPSIGVNGVGNIGIGNVNGQQCLNADMNNGQDLAILILSLMDSFCMGGQMNLDQVLGLGVGNEQQMFQQLAQLAQLNSQGFMDLGTVQSLIQSNLLFGGAPTGPNVGMSPPLNLKLWM